MPDESIAPPPPVASPLPLAPSPTTVTVTTTGTGAGGDAAFSAMLVGRWVESIAKALTIIILAGGSVYGLVVQVISGEGFISIVLAAFGWYAVSRLLDRQQSPQSTVVKTTPNQAPSNGV